MKYYTIGVVVLTISVKYLLDMIMDIDLCLRAMEKYPDLWIAYLGIVLCFVFSGVGSLMLVISETKQWNSAFYRTARYLKDLEEPRELHIEEE